ncbi:hypothetical protein [Nonomuraea rubra]|uniref:Uncharacterized protein n=1 Tax=Nonomuraea rubra TaxID=46180 RepID=A0A7X0P846_9ACTN|nr:hypothetical protein [Nonomuraea rubra]MBB6557034.1 hypothetical protein [Nonomuraea rubra]
MQAVACAALPGAELVRGTRPQDWNEALRALAKGPVAGHIYFVGSIEWLDNRPFDRHDYDELVRDAPFVPGAALDTPKIAASRAGAEPGLSLDGLWRPEDLIAAWTA